MNIWKRTLRTTSSERFLATRDGKDVAAVDLHYLANGTVSGTVILLKEAGWKEAEIHILLQSLDEDFLPEVDLSSGTLTFTVVLGEVLGNFEATVNAGVESGKDRN
ncbi:MAG: hypothetical protein EBU46_18085 [Nitrosomonadaceae bacterium]|nr:hypothetical protein [Nitrosomonadaceae bacterium]